MNLYSYDGSVMSFNDCICRRWKSQTKAVSESKARTNLMYQWKMQNKLAVNAKISLPGKITIIQ